MKIKFALPSFRESILAVLIIILFAVLTAIYVGFRPEHALLIALFCVLFFTTEQSRKLVVGLIPFIIFGVSYDWMRVFPNYMVNPIDVEPLYNLEKSIFGITEGGGVLIPCEYFAIHNNTVGDFLSGIFYLGWVPIPIAFGFYMYVKKKNDIFLRFSMVFLFVNILGFICYYIHPAAPPWYVMEHGFEPVLDTPGNMAGLARFDDLIGFPLYDSIYGRNANVFAALPSLHSAYLVIVLFYAVKSKCNIPILITIIIFMFGIWFTAVYTAHHYIIDVLLGVVFAVVGICIFEYILMKLSLFKAFFRRYLAYIV